jgi:hypothetical protein
MVVIKRGKDLTIDVRFSRADRKVLARGIDFSRFVSFVTANAKSPVPNDLVQANLRFMEVLALIGYMLMADPFPGDQELDESLGLLIIALENLTFKFMTWAGTKPEPYSDIDLGEIMEVGKDLLVEAINQLKARLV